MNFTKKLSLNKRTQRFLSILIYLLFIFFMAQLIYKEPQGSVKLTYAIMLILFGFFAFYYDYLKWLYEKATLALIDHCDPERSRVYMTRLKKFDFFKSYKTSLHIFNLLVLRDLGQHDSIINYIDTTGKKPFSSSFDLLLVYYYSLFDTFCTLKNIEKANEYYDRVTNLKGKKMGMKKISPLFSWEEIEAQHEYLLGHNKESKKHLELVNLASMNKREQVYFHMLSAKVELGLKNFNKVHTHLDFVIENGGKMHIVDEARALKRKP